MSTVDLNVSRDYLFKKYCENQKFHGLGTTLSSYSIQYIKEWQNDDAPRPAVNLRRRISTAFNRGPDVDLNNCTNCCSRKFWNDLNSSFEKTIIGVFVAVAGIAMAAGVIWLLVSINTTDGGSSTAHCSTDDPLPFMISIAGWCMFGAGLVGTGIISHRMIKDVDYGDDDADAEKPEPRTGKCKYLMMAFDYLWAMFTDMIERMNIFCSPALHFTDTMTDFAAVAEFWIIASHSTQSDCGFVLCSLSTFTVQDSV